MNRQESNEQSLISEVDKDIIKGGGELEGHRGISGERH
jgi:hypothetical protein